MTVIYGLLIATFLTLIVVPILFYLITRFKMWLYSNRVQKSTEKTEDHEARNENSLIE